ncbi:YggT family protein [Bacteriovorax stolpii]|uniref:Uncharacterized protein n=1 Tax=Bacteriovorax stolpii TaxID=960 RepID=A0A2K9NNX0_BACTC|nr:YggT family protein [Bacteriovorax stolpii]AUN97187.1 hypothetical protein C0V70_03495 [Bacteriovorax stolpii]QDK42874.1 YggT family protein [Bacteriovorax stolpii]TDP53474.1 YggT family protein [Bacteriovorax stolpii]
MIRFIIRLYTILLMLDAILSFFPETSRYQWRQKLKKICDYTCDPVRRYMPQGLPFDLSPIVVVFLLYIFVEIFSFLW